MIIISIFISISTAVVELFTAGEATVVFYSYAFVVPLIILIPHAARAVNRELQERTTERWLLWMDRIVFGIVAINIPGSIYLHDAGIQYDRFVHFGGAFLLFFMLVLLYLSFYGEKTGGKKQRITALVLSFFLLFVGLFLWEVYQYTVDQIFGTQLFFDVAQSIQVDFWEDIFFGLLGISTALFYTSYSFRKFLSVLK
ncbi:MAG: hypothetical protein BMS9Abin13_272 [Patescibacteria group bacterium]|nr:MAG: hypothetical protein BMS9Abin13_272 [Patescibacteria group bacterium]